MDIISSKTNENQVLTVAEYESAELEAILNLPNSIIRAHQPIHFNSNNVPNKVINEYELWKYIDDMHPIGFEDNLKYLLGGLTEHEFDLFKEINRKILLFSETKFKKKLIPKDSLIRAFSLLRQIKYIFGDARPRIFEVGPGAGYLGALLILDGYSYASTDISQSYYLFQNHLWNFLTNGKVVELALDELSLKNIYPHTPETVHIPWWKFVGMKSESVPSCDIVICNHALGEMHTHSLIFMLRMARKFLSNKNNLRKVFMFEGNCWGAQGQNNTAKITEYFYNTDFGLVHNDEWVSIFTPGGTENHLHSLPLPKRIAPKFRWLNNIILYIRGLGLLPSFILSYKPPFRYSSDSNPISKSIHQGRENDKDLKIVDLSKIKRFYKDLLGDEDFISPDEKFLRSIGLIFQSSFISKAKYDKQILTSLKK